MPKKKNLLLVYDRCNSGSQVKTKNAILIKIILFVIEINVLEVKLLLKNIRNILFYYCIRQ